MLIGLKRSKVPNFLRCSEFFNGLQEEDEKFYVDSQNFVENDRVDSDAKLLNLLHTLRFWGVNNLPDTVVNYIIRSNSAATFEVVRNFGPDYLPLRGLCEMEGKGPDRYAELACQCGNIDLLKYFLARRAQFPIDVCAVVGAATHGHLSCLELSYDACLSSELNSLERTYLIIEAAHCGHLGCLKFLISKGFGYDTVTAARFGHLECLKYVHEHGEQGGPWDDTVTQGAVESGQLACLKYAHEQGCPLPKNCASVALKHGHTDCMMYCLNHGGELMPSACSEACMKGNLELLTYAHQHGKRLTVKCMQNAAFHGHLHCMQYLHAHRCRWDTSVCESAVKGAAHNAAREDACLDCLRYALDHGCRCNADIYINVARVMTQPQWQCLREHGVTASESLVRGIIQCGDLHCLQLAVQQGTPVPADACELALKDDDLPILQYLHEQANQPLPDDACDLAIAASRKSTCLRYVRQQGCEWDETTFEVAAKSGCVENMRYLHRHGCPWDATACAAAASADRLDGLKFLHANGCPWDEQVLISAITGYKKATFTYAIEQGCPMGVDACIAAAKVTSTNYPYLQTLHERGCAWDERVCAAAATCAWNATNLQYLHEHGCPWDATTCTTAVKAHHVDCLRYAHEHGCPYDQDLCLLAAEAGAYFCLVYAHKSMGCPVSEQVSAAAAAAVRVDRNCLVYLVEEACCPISAATMCVYNKLAK